VKCVEEAIARRGALLERLHAEGTDCYRLFHGAVEGCAGLVVDRYGPVVLVQTFREPLGPEDQERLVAVLAEHGAVVFHHRGEGKPWVDPPGTGPVHAREDGYTYEITVRPGKDPGLFLDFRAARRWVREHVAGAVVLNLFAYTCGVGVAAAAGGCAEVTNVDFSPGALAVGRRNADANGITADIFLTEQADVLPTLRQLAGLPVKGRGPRRRSFRRFEPKTFDLVVLDPPTWATSPFGAVDPVRDYPALFKPAVLATRAGGRVLATHHVSAVDRDDWHEQLRRCAAKAGRPIRDLAILEPNADFPSPDGRPPLKMVVVEV